MGVARGTQYLYIFIFNLFTLYITVNSFAISSSSVMQHTTKFTIQRMHPQKTAIISETIHPVNTMKASYYGTSTQKSQGTDAKNATTGKGKDCGCNDNASASINDKSSSPLVLAIRMACLLVGITIAGNWARGFLLARKRRDDEPLEINAQVLTAADRAQRRFGLAITGIALVGVGVAAYLTLAHLNVLSLVCDESVFQCDRVAEHPLAHGFGIPGLQAIPTAVFGLLAYAGIAGLALLKTLAGDARLRRWVYALQYGLVYAAMLASAGLSYAEAFVIHAWCLWCVISAIVSVILFMLVLLEWHSVKREGYMICIGWRSPTFHQTALVCGIGAALCAIFLVAMRTPEVPPTPFAQVDRQVLQAVGGVMHGPSKAPFILVEFGNYQCIHCRASLPEVRRLQQRTGEKLQMIFLPASKPSNVKSTLLTRAVLAAGKQGKMAAMHEAVFAEQERWRAMDDQTALRRALVTTAAKLGLQRGTFQRDLSDPAIMKQSARFYALAKQYSAFPSPAFLFITPSSDGTLLHSTAQMLRWVNEPKHWEAAQHEAMRSLPAGGRNARQ